MKETYTLTSFLLQSNSVFLTTNLTIKFLSANNQIQLLQTYYVNSYMAIISALIEFREKKNSPLSSLHNLTFIAFVH